MNSAREWDPHTGWISRPWAACSAAVGLAALALTANSAVAASADPAPAASAAAPQQSGEWWLELSLPSPAAVPPAQRQAQLAQVQQQQAEVTHQVIALGGRVTGAVSRVGNALAVRVDAPQLEALRRLTSVRSVRPVLHQHKPMTGP